MSAKKATVTRSTVLLTKTEARAVYRLLRQYAEGWHYRSRCADFNRRLDVIEAKILAALPAPKKARKAK